MESLPCMGTDLLTCAVSPPSPSSSRNVYDRTLLAEGTLQASMDRNCVVTGELFPFEFEAEFSTYIKVRVVNSSAPVAGV